MASMPHGHCLDALQDTPVAIYNFHLRVPFTKENALVPLPFQKGSLQARHAYLHVLYLYLNYPGKVTTNMFISLYYWHVL